MIKFNTTLTTSGTGYWSTIRKNVRATGMEVSYINDERTFGELRVYFDTATWDTAVDGLIYTDKQFRTELRAYLQTLGFAAEEANDVSYSEQGMQGDNYVSCDVGKKFLANWFDIVDITIGV